MIQINTIFTHKCSDSFPSVEKTSVNAVAITGVVDKVTDCIPHDKVRLMIKSCHCYHSDGYKIIVNAKTSVF